MVHIKKIKTLKAKQNKQKNLINTLDFSELILVK